MKVFQYRQWRQEDWKTGRDFILKSADARLAAQDSFRLHILTHLSLYIPMRDKSPPSGDGSLHDVCILCNLVHCTRTTIPSPRTVQGTASEAHNNSC
jgi:hypothetical protein